MIDHIGATTTLSNGIEMPWLGLGVFNADDGDEVRDAVTWALDAGYRHVDTASVYRNERGIGEAIRRSAIPRDEIFVTTKVWNTDQGHERTLRALDASLERLGLAYVDLFLVHWPRPLLTEETWRAMEQTLGEGRTRAIGVSNFLVHHLEQLLASATVPPAVNQVEFHPHLQQPDLVRFCAEHDIRFEAWSPLKRGRILDHPTLTEIGRRHDATVAQVILRWDLQRGIVTIPKSVTKHRIEENARLYHFTLSDEEVAAIDALDAGDRIGPHPDVFPG
jgi:diketogulonate reductase-like aldo/keto reductase